MNGRVTPLPRVTSAAWGPPPPCKQALTQQHYLRSVTSFQQQKSVLSINVQHYLVPLRHQKLIPKDNIILNDIPPHKQEKTKWYL